jgi:two-component system, LytTR family, response regulator
MIRVVIVDDEPAARRTLREFCAAEPDLQLVGEFGEARAALEAIRAEPPDLLFLDIQLDSASGLELARSLDARAPPLIVFVTAYDQYALEAFEVSATDYLLKPYDAERFAKTLARVRQRWDAQSAADRGAALASVLTQLEQRTRAAADTRSRLLAEVGSRLCMIDVATVELAEANRNYVKLIIGRETYNARSTLQQAEKALEAQPMLRISRSCLVNVNHVREVSRTPRGDFIFVLAGGTTVTSSEGYRDPVREYLSRLRVSPA